MAHYHNEYTQQHSQSTPPPPLSHGQQQNPFPHQQQQPPLPPLPHHSRGSGSLDSNTDPGAVPLSSPDVNGSQYIDHGYSNMSGRSNSTSARHSAELFMSAPHQSPQLPPPPPPPRRNSGSISGQPYAGQSGYSPQNFINTSLASSMASGNRQSPSSGGHAPYNPADYADYTPTNTDPYGTSGSYQFSMSSPGYPTGAANQSMYMPSPALHTPPATSGPQAMHSSRPSVQTSYSHPHYTPPAPPPLPAIPGSAGDSPSDDWGRFPGNMTRYTSVRHRYNDGSITSPPLPSPPAHQRGRSSRTNSITHPTSPAHAPPPPPPPPPPRHGSSARMSTADQYQLQSRPLPQLPSQSSSPQPDYFPEHDSNEYQHVSTSESLIQGDLENDIMNDLGATPAPSISVQRPEINDAYYDSDSDPEAMAGLEAMREAERQDAEDAARRPSTSSHMYSYSSSLGGGNSSTHEPSDPFADESDDDVPPVDLGSMGGGFDARMSYGGPPVELAVTRNGSLSQPASSSGSMRRSTNMSDNDSSANHFSSSYSQARVDGYGTGGLADPSQRSRRLSFDEGDDDQAIGDPPEMFYHPGITGRPLPPPPAEAQNLRHHSASSAPYLPEWRGNPVEYPRSPSFQSPVQPGPNRHLSLVAVTNTPPALAPTRAKTDAEERRKSQRHSAAIGTDSSGENTAASAVTAIDLPSVTKKYTPAKLGPRDFDRCMEPWALSAVTKWLRNLVEEEQYLKKQPLVDGLVALFTYKVPTMNIADAETLAAKLVDEMQTTGTLIEEEEWLFFTDEPMSGVVFQLTGAGCYSPMVHSYEAPGRCYSQHCQRTEKKIDLSTQSDTGPEKDWVDYYEIKKEDMDKFPKKEVERQNILHEIVQKEENYLRELNIVTSLYRDRLSAANPPQIPPKNLPSFIKDVFGKVDAVKQANEDHLLPQMKYRQKEQGPWIVGFSDIFREWIRKAKSAYVEYASSYPNAVFKVRQEMERNMLFRAFLNECQQDPRSRRLGYDHYLKLPLSRLQQVGLLLETALRKSAQDNDEKRNLQIAIEEIKAVTFECDTCVGIGTRKVELSDLQSKLKLRPGMPRVELNLDHLGRELIFQGDLMRVGNTRFTWLETHVILFDHYLVLAKMLNERPRDGGAQLEQYDVFRLPIQLDLLVLESRDDDPVIKTLTGVSRAGPTVSDKTLSKVNTKELGSPASLIHSNTSASINSLNSAKSAPPMVTNLDNSENRIMYPFRVRHLGKETYTLYALSHQNREDWCNKIIEAKTKHARALFAQNAEPFKIKVIADSAFAYEGSITGQRSITIEGTPLDRAVREVESMYSNTGRPGPVCRARVNCATSFSQAGGRSMVAVGTDYGVYVSEMDNPRGWQKVIVNLKVTQVAVLEEFSLFLLISDKSLIAYHLDVVCPAGGVPPANDSSRRAPQKLSGSRDVGFFATGRMKERTLVFYKKRDGISSTFKVLEPVLQRSTERRARFTALRSGKTEFFRDFDEFYIPTECMGINMFHTSLAISTQKGFEILNLDKKQPISIPDLEAPHVAAIAQRLNGQKPLGMFRLSEQEFLLCYEEYAVYVNKHGDISRSVIMEFVGKARTAALYGPYLLLFDQDFVEIRNAQNGRLRQVISGRDVKCLDDALSGGSAGNRTIKLSLQHPEVEKLQIVVELVLNEGTRE